MNKIEIKEMLEDLIQIDNILNGNFEYRYCAINIQEPNKSPKIILQKNIKKLKEKLEVIELVKLPRTLDTGKNLMFFTKKELNKILQEVENDCKFFVLKLLSRSQGYLFNLAYISIANINIELEGVPDKIFEILAYDTLSDEQVKTFQIWFIPVLKKRISEAII